MNNSLPEWRRNVNYNLEVTQAFDFESMNTVGGVESNNVRIDPTEADYCERGCNTKLGYSVSLSTNRCGNIAY